MRRILICGSREFDNYKLLKDTLEDYLKGSNPQELVIVSGHARGADSLAEQYAKWKSIKLELFPAEWNRYGKSAGIVRNLKMAEVADECVAFKAKGSKSIGTSHMISIMHDKNKPVKEIIEQ